MKALTASVGRFGRNQEHDVKLVQTKLNGRLPNGIPHLRADGVCGSKTLIAIRAFQRTTMRSPHPDGLIEPNGPTWRFLNASAHELPHLPTQGTSAQFTNGLASLGINGATAQANAQAVLQSLKDAGITSRKAQANILAQVNAECGFVPRTEQNWSAESLFKLYGSQQSKNKVRFQTLADAKAVVAQGPEAVFEKIYGGRMGNTAPGDGYKYRGRGYIQLTGKDNYSRVGSAIGNNLVGNPDLANDPGIATKVLLNFLGVSSANQASFENIATVNAKVGPAASTSSRSDFASGILDYI